MRIHKVIVVCVLGFYVSLNAMEQVCQFVPVMNGASIENGPIVALCVAKQSQVFSKMLDDVSSEMQTISFVLPDCDERAVKLFATYLIDLHDTEEKKSPEAQTAFVSRIASLSQEEKICLCNIAEFAIVPSLSGKVYDELIKSPVDQGLLSHLNPDIRKKIASFFIMQNGGDATLLKAYSEKLRTKECVLEREDWLLRPFIDKKQICYFDDTTNTIVGVIKSGASIKALYITKLHPLQRWSTTLALLSKKIIGCEEVVIEVPENFFDRVVFFAMNADETRFFCTFASNIHRESFFVDIAQKAVAVVQNNDESVKQFLDEAKSDTLFSLSRTSQSIIAGYALCNHMTKNVWNFDYKIFSQSETLLHNKQQIIRVDKLDLSKTILVNCVDDVMNRFVKYISSGQLPFVVHTITSNPVGRVALNDQEYEEYENVPEGCRHMIDSVYVVTKDTMLSRGIGIVRHVHRIVFPYIQSGAVWCAHVAWAAIIPIVLSVLIPRISSKEFSDVLEVVSKI